MLEKLSAKQKRDLAILDQIGALDKENGTRLDAAPTLHLLNELRFVKAQTFDVKYAPIKSALFIPFDMSVSPGADSVTYRQYDQFGAFQLINHAADDLPEVEVTRKEFTAPIKSIGGQYSYTLQDLRRSAEANTNLSMRKKIAAQKAAALYIDAAAATGIPEIGTKGFINHSNIPILTLPNVGSWNLETVTPIQILADIAAMVNAVAQNSKETFEADTFVFSNVLYDYINTKPASSTVPNETILQVAKRNHPEITSWDRWQRLNGAGVSATNRMICYKKDPEVMEFTLPLPFEELPPQPKNLAFQIPCHSRVGAFEIHYPLAAVYGDVSLS